MPVSIARSADLGGVYRDLAALCVRAANEPLQQVVEALLRRTAALVGASRAVLLPMQSPDGRPSARPLEEVVAAGASASDAELAALAAEWTGRALTVAGSSVVWTRYRLAVPASVHDETPPEQEAAGHVALLCFGWDDEMSAAKMGENATRLLDKVQDGVRAVLLQALAAERVRGPDRVSPRVPSAEHAEADWEQAFDAISDPMCIISGDYHLIRANAAYVRLFGEDVAQREPHVCFGGQTGTGGPCAGCPLPTTVRTAMPAFVRQERVVPTGAGGALERRVYERWTYPITAATGEVTRVVELVKDVTDDERLREKVSRSEALREADRLKAELLGTVSHELRSPLTMIKGFAATLLRHERRLPREERREFLIAINDACDRLSLIIERLLEMSQLETGSLRLDKRPVDLAPLVATAVESARAAAAKEAQPLRIQWRVDGRAGTGEGVPVVYGDSRRLRDVLDNLLENARKYSLEGGTIEVVLRAAGSEPARVAGGAGSGSLATPDGSIGGIERIRPDDRFVELCVYDTGVGIPPEHLDSVFDRSHRVDTGLTREVAGMGLGLALCKRIVELHDGTIWAESRPGEGSAFHVLLPIATEIANAGMKGRD